MTGVGQWGDWRDRVRLVELSLWELAFRWMGGPSAAWEHKEGRRVTRSFWELAGWIKRVWPRRGLVRVVWNFWAAFDLFVCFLATALVLTAVSVGGFKLFTYERMFKGV